MEWIWGEDSQAPGLGHLQLRGPLGDSWGWGWDVRFEISGKEAAGCSRLEAKEPKVSRTY